MAASLETDVRKGTMAMTEIIMVTRKPVTLQAARWHKNGDHPDDGVGMPRYDQLSGESYQGIEGAVVRFYRHPDRRGDHVHQKCGRVFHEHGFIDHYDGGERVCPGDWIVSDENGRHRAVHDERFRQEYEIVSHIVT